MLSEITKKMCLKLENDLTDLTILGSQKLNFSLLARLAKKMGENYALIYILVEHLYAMKTATACTIHEQTQ